MIGVRSTFEFAAGTQILKTRKLEAGMESEEVMKHLQVSPELDIHVRRCVQAPIRRAQETSYL